MDDFSRVVYSYLGECVFLDSKPPLVTRILYRGRLKHREQLRKEIENRVKAG